MDSVIVPKLVIKTLSDQSIKCNLDDIKTVADIYKFLINHGTIGNSNDMLIISHGRILDSMDTLDGVELIQIPTEPHPSKTVYLFYYEPSALAIDTIETAKDWDAKNRLRCFKGLYLLSHRRNPMDAAPLLVDSMTTFQEDAFVPFSNLVKYSIVSALLAFDRPRLLKLQASPEFLMESINLKHTANVLKSLCKCDYRGLFLELAEAEQKEWLSDWLLKRHALWITKEIRIRAYSQLLRSYRSLTLNFMAQAFGVSIEFIDLELSRFIAADRISATIDYTRGMVDTVNRNVRNAEFVSLLKASDAVLSRLQKLRRVMTWGKASC